MLDLALAATVAGLLGVSAKDLWQAFDKAREDAKRELAEGSLAGFLAGSARAFDEHLDVELANRLYPDDELATAGLERYVAESDGTRVPTTLVTRGSWRQLGFRLTDNALRYVVSDERPEYPLPDKDEASYLLARMQARGIRIWNAPIYRLLAEPATKDVMTVSLAVDQFLRYRLTTGSMQDELVQALINADFDVDRAVKSRATSMPKRARFLPSARAVCDFGSRLVCTGISFLTAIARPSPHDDFALVLQKRSKAVSTRQGILGVVPAAHHQPIVDVQAEADLRRTVLREFYEELLGGDDAEGETKRLLPDWYERACPAMKFFSDHAGAFDIVLTGFGVSLLSGSANFMGLLVIHDEYFWRRHGHELRTNWEASTQMAPVVSTRSKSLRSLLKTQRFGDYSAYAFLEGLRILQDRYAERM